MDATNLNQLFFVVYLQNESFWCRYIWVHYINLYQNSIKNPVLNSNVQKKTKLEGDVLYFLFVNVGIHSFQESWNLIWVVTMILQTGLKFWHIFEVLNFRIILPKSLKTISRHLLKSNMWIKSPKLSKALFKPCWTKKTNKKFKTRFAIFWTLIG